MALLDDDTAAQDYGALFGGAGQSFIAPFMGQGGQRAAMDNSLLNMGAAMMQNSGPSFDPSHRSFLSSLGGGLGAAQQAYQGSIQRGLQSAGAAQSLAMNRLAYQRQLMMLRAAASLNPDGPVASGAQPSVAADVAGAGASMMPGMPAGVSGPLAGLPQTAGNPSSTPMPAGAGAGGGVAPGTMAQPAGTGAGGPVSGATPASGRMSPLNPAGLPGPLAQYEMLSDPASFFSAQNAMFSPTDIQKQMTAMGIDPKSDVGKQILSDAIARNTAPQVTRLSNGSYVKNGQFVGVPNAEGLIVQPNGVDAQGNPTNFSMSAVPGAAEAQTTLATARAAGPATFKTVQTYDPRTKQMVATPQTVNAQAAGAYTPPGAAGPMSGLPAPLRNNNPGALMTGPGGTLGQYPTPQAGMQAMDSQLQTYATRDGLNTVEGIINKWNPPNGKGNTPEGTRAYIGDVAQQLGIKPGDTLNMADPATRQALAMAMANHENGRAAVAASGVGAAAAPAGMPTSAPLGTPQREQASQEAAANSMEKDYNGMQQFRQAAPAQLNSIDKMLALAQNKTILSTGPLGDTEMATDLNPAAAEYEKQRANYLQTAGAVGTDAQRATQAHALPDYGKPKAAIIDGLQTQRQQVQQGMLRAQFLTPAYNAGDATKYTQSANDFDQHVTPPIAAVLSMPPGPAQKAAYNAIVAKNPALKANFQWALDNGMLK